MRIAYLMDHDKLLILATPYYEKGRPGDLQHIAWLQRRLIELKDRIDDAGHDFEVTSAVTILHDVGYSQLPPGYDPFDLSARKRHQIESAKIAKQILLQAGFPKSKMSKTLRIIRHHDDWAFGKPLQDPEWRIFTDLDFSWEASRRGFDIVRRFLKQDRKAFLKTVKAHYKKKQLLNPFLLPEAKTLFLQDLRSWDTRLRRGARLRT
jgi:hypothetical protein